MNITQKVATILGLTVLASISANAAPPQSLSGLVLGASIQEIKDKYGTRMKLSPEGKEDLADSRCGIDRYEIDLPEFYGEEAYFYQGNLFTVRMKMRAVLTMPEMYALAKRFVAKYGPPNRFLCAYSNEPVIARYSIDKCESKPEINLIYESGGEGSVERYEFYAAIYSTAYTQPDPQGYYLNLTKGWRYYHDITETCRKRALLAIDEENAGRVTLPE